MSSSSHGSRISKKVQSSPSRVESGMIASCSYTNRHGEKKEYLVICINANYNGEFHCYKLNNFHPSDVDGLAIKLGTIVTNKIIHIKVGNPQNFYSSLKTIGKRDFKRFNHKNMSGTAICDYKLNAGI